VPSSKSDPMPASPLRFRCPLSLFNFTRLWFCFRTWTWTCHLALKGV